MTDYEEVFPQLFGRAYRLGLRLLGSSGDAEDVAAESMARAYLAWGRLRGPEHQTAWVLRVTTNLAIDLIRKRRRAETQELPASPGDDAAMRVVLAEALRRLPERQRQVVVLRYLVDMSEHDVAALLDISAGSVKQHVHRGLRRLRRNLPDDTVFEVPAWQ